MNRFFLSPRGVILALHALRRSPLAEFVEFGALLWVGALLGFALAVLLTGTPPVKALAFVPFLVPTYYAVCLLDALRRNHLR